MIKATIKIIGILVLGALGAAIFEYFAFPYFLAERGKITVNKTEQVYIQENVALEHAAKNVQKSVVGIEKNGITIGSGLIITSDGSVITLASLVSSGIKIILNREYATYKIVKKDLKNNLALIKIEAKDLPTVGFADFDKLMLVQRVFLLGILSAKTGNAFVNEGIIRVIDKPIKTNIYEKNIAAGAPLFNISGELMGLSFIDQDGKISAIPSDIIKTFLGI